VNTLISETNLKYELTTLCQSEILLFMQKSHTKYVAVRPPLVWTYVAYRY